MNQTSGNIFVRETNGLIIDGLGMETQGGNGNIGVDVDAGNLTTNSQVRANGSGNITLNADAATVGLNASVRSTTGNVDIDGDDVTQNAEVMTGGVGTINVVADAGNIVMADGSLTMADIGQISYQSALDVALSRLVNMTTIAVTATGGQITDNRAGDGLGNENVVTAAATLAANDGIGSGDAVNTSVDTLAATNTTSGSLQIQETSGLILNGTGVRTLGGDGPIVVDVDAGDLTNDAVVTADGTGSVNLNADNGTVDVNAVVSSTEGAIGISGNAVTQDANLATGGAGTISVIADTTDITMATGTEATAAAAIVYTARDNVALTRLATSDVVTVAASSGGIFDNTPLLTEITTGTTVTLNAATGIGAGTGQLGEDEAIDVNATTLNATNSSLNAIQIVEQEGVALGLIDNSTSRTVVIDATDTITDGNAAAGNLVAGDAILRGGMGVGADLAGSLETSVSRLEAAGGTGGLFLVNDRQLEIADVSTGGGVAIDGARADQDIALAITVGDLLVNQPIESFAQSIDVNASENLLANATITGMMNVRGTAGNTLSINADVVAMAGSIDLAVLRNEIAAFDFNSGVLRSSGGNVSPDVFLTVDILGVGPRYSALDTSSDMSLQPITTDSIAMIELAVSDAMATSTMTVQIDWRESMSVVSLSPPFQSGVLPVDVDPGPVPLSDVELNAQVLQSVLAAPQLSGLYEHRYVANPDGAESPVIYVPVIISAFAGEMINIDVGGDDIQNFVQPAGSLTDQFGDLVEIGDFDTQVGIMVVVTLEVLDFPVGQTLPLPEALPTAPPAPPAVMPAAAPAAPVARIATAPPLPNSAGTTGQAELRYYELRIVGFNQQGQLLETADQRINLNDDELRAIAPFNPSKLPELFKRLPGDRYRLYLVEDGAERLVLEFVIERAGGEGRPVELPERSEIQQPELILPGSPPASDATLEEVGQQEKRDAALPMPTALTSSATSAVTVLNGQDAFAQHLGRASFVASGGVLFGSAMFTKRERKRREDRADARMAAFRRRLRLRGKNQPAIAARQPNTTMSKDS